MPTSVDALSISNLIDQGELRTAAERLVIDHGSEVLGLCTSMLSDRAAAEDLAQDVFSRAIAGLDHFRGDSSPRTWLLAIARNSCLDHLRRSQRAPWLADGDFEAEEHADDTPLPSDLLSDRDQLSRALSTLDEQDRSLVMLRFCHGFDYGEIAQVFGIKQGTARMRVSRVLARMRAELTPDPIFPPPMSARIESSEIELATPEPYPATTPHSIDGKVRAAILPRMGAEPASIEKGSRRPATLAERLRALLRRAWLGVASPASPLTAPADDFARALEECEPAFSTDGLRSRLRSEFDRL